MRLASGEPYPPEYLLPLNKLLCGMELAEVFDFGPPISAVEAQECDDLLGAVIAQAPILRDMSVPGFRGTFLLLPGLLRARDGAWLLQVERETYDIVLERFPWSWKLIISSTSLKRTSPGVLYMMALISTGSSPVM